MDFSQFDHRAAADSGFWLHLKHPQTGALLYNEDKPCRVRVLGAEGRDAQRRIAEAQAKHPRRPDETPEQSHKRQVAILAALLVEIEGVEFDGKPATADQAERLIDLQLPGEKRTGLSFFEQIDAASTTRGNYLGNSNGS